MSARDFPSPDPAALTRALESHPTPTDRARACREFLTAAASAARASHDAGAPGPEVAAARSAAHDTVLQSLLACHPALATRLTLVAVAAYGRGLLNPHSGVRFLVLASGSAAAAAAPLLETLAALELPPALPPAPAESFSFADDFPLAADALDARLVAGAEAPFAALQAAARANAATDRFAARLAGELKSRHQRSANTVFLQEPNVKESCGGLDDWFTLPWICLAKQGTPDLAGPLAAEILTSATLTDLTAAASFLHRVRNELHFHGNAPTDRLTLMLQGVVANAFRYPQRDILRRTEALMRDYYRHSLALHQHTTALAEHLLAPARPAPDSVCGETDDDHGHHERFDGFQVQHGRLETTLAAPFDEDPHRLMRLFLHCQVRQLTPGPRLRQLITAQWPHIDRSFRHSRANSETFQAILERKGQVAATLRLMHRCGVLGRYLPEFGALDCLVQHEFFHRYTADEHTLRCLDELDGLITDTRPDRAIFRHLLHQIADPYAFHLAVILHDTGRAENVREHIDGSAMLAAKLCNRLHLRGPRRTLIMFLVDNHLTFWRTATTRNLEDPEVITEFATVVKTQSNLDALLLFTYCDSNGTNPDAWNGWKQSLMLQLHTATRRFLAGGARAAYDHQLEADRIALRDEVTALMRPDYHADISRHFDLMPATAFHYREARPIVTQIRTVRQFVQSQAAATKSPCAIKWLDHPGKGYTELILASRDRPMLLEKLCCALAACAINILSADFFTRGDSIVVDVFRVCTTDHEPVADPALRESFTDCFHSILLAASHDPARYLHHLQDHSPADHAIPVQARVTNDLHPTCTTVEIQAVDRIGLLHDLFHTINRHGLTTAHARICTEKGVAMDTLYITTPEGGRITAPEVLDGLSRSLSTVVRSTENPA